MTYPGQCLLAFISVYVFTHKYAAQLQFFFTGMLLITTLIC